MQVTQRDIQNPFRVIQKLTTGFHLQPQAPADTFDEAKAAWEGRGSGSELRHLPAAAKGDPRPNDSVYGLASRSRVLAPGLGREEKPRVAAGTGGQH